MGYDEVLNTAAYLAEASPSVIGTLLGRLDALTEDYRATELRAKANAQMHKAAEAECSELRAKLKELEARLA